MIDLIKKNGDGEARGIRVRNERQGIKMKKRIVLIVVAAAILSALFVAIFPSAVFAEDEISLSSPIPDSTYNAWDGGADRGWYTSPKHAGTAEDPYIVSNESELAGLSELVAEGVTFEGKYIALSRSMYMNAVIPSTDAYDIDLWIKWANIKSWTPIGDSSAPFKGNFDGRGNAVFGLYIDLDQNAGLFGYTQNATVKNISISHSYISSSSYAGAIIAYMFAFDGASSVENCFSDAYIYGGGSAKCVGGIVGYSYAFRGNIEIKNCAHIGIIEVESRYGFDIGVGGIVGYARSLHDYGLGAYFKVSGCINTGTVTNASTLHTKIGTGGVVGTAEARNTDFSISDCRNRGEIFGVGSTGGVVGDMHVTTGSKTSLCVTRCANVATVTGRGFTGGVVGLVSSTLSTLPTEPVVFVEKSFNSGVVVGTGTTGGLIGTMHSSGSRIAALNCFTSGRVWSTYSQEVELALRLVATSETYGGASSLVGKIISDSTDGAVVELANLYTVAEYTEQDESGFAGYVLGNCYCGGESSMVYVYSVFYPKTGYQVVGRITGDQSSNIACRGLETDDFAKEQSFTGFDFVNVWTNDKNGLIASPVISGNDYEKTLCMHKDCQWAVSKKATCTENGIKLYSCTLCGEVLDSETIVAAGHTPGGWLTKTEPTCTESGLRVKDCIVCGEEIETEVIPAVGHKPSDWAVVTAPTCTESGVEAVVCIACGSILQTRQIPATGHDYVTEIIKEATYDEDGLERATCRNCGATVDTVIPMLVCAHEQTETRVDKEASCAEEGHTVVVCLICGKTVSETIIEKLPHAESETVIAKAPTCTEAGLMQRRCKACGEVFAEESIPATGHSLGDWTTVIPATCLEGGEDRKFCQNCGETMLIKQTAALGHTPGDVIIKTPATCTEEGVGEYHCIRCDKLISSFTIPAAGHKMSSVPTVTEATCKEVGRRDYFCIVCGELMKTEEIPKAEHVPVYERIDPTCTESGSERFVCSVCGEIISEMSLKATGHTFAQVTIDGLPIKKCVICGYLKAYQPTDSGTESDSAGSGGIVGTDTAPGGEKTSSTFIVIILIAIIAVFAAVCIFIILRSNRRSRLDE